MPERVDLFDSTYKRFTDQVLDAIGKDTFGTDISQNSWVTVDEYERLLPWLKLAQPTCCASKARSASQDCSNSSRQCIA